MSVYLENYNEVKVSHLYSSFQSTQNDMKLPVAPEDQLAAEPTSSAYWVYLDH